MYRGKSSVRMVFYYFFNFSSQPLERKLCYIFWVVLLIEKRKVVFPQSPLAACTYCIRVPISCDPISASGTFNDFNSTTSAEWMVVSFSVCVRVLVKDFCFIQCQRYCSKRRYSLFCFLLKLFILNQLRSDVIANTFFWYTGYDLIVYWINSFINKKYP